MFWFCQKMSSVAECYRRGTAAAKRSPCVNSKAISVGYILGRDPKLKHAELQAPQSEQQTQCLENIWIKKSAKTTDKGEQPLIRRCWTNLVMQSKKVKCRKDSIVWLLSKDGYLMAEWLRLWTATLIWSLALASKTISVGNNLGRDRKLTLKKKHLILSNKFSVYKTSGSKKVQKNNRQI